MRKTKLAYGLWIIKFAYTNKVVPTLIHYAVVEVRETRHVFLSLRHLLASPRYYHYIFLEVGVAQPSAHTHALTLAQTEWPECVHTLPVHCTYTALACADNTPILLVRQDSHINGKEAVAPEGHARHAIVLVD